MKTVLCGEIIDYNPVVNAKITGKKFIFNTKGKILMTIDTGFSGGIALPSDILAKIETEFVAYQSFVLANGKSEELKVFSGKVIIGNNITETVFIEGDYLIGMELMSSIAKLLSIDFGNKKLKLITNNNLAI